MVLRAGPRDVDRRLRGGVVGWLRGRECGSGRDRRCRSQRCGGSRLDNRDAFNWRSRSRLERRDLLPQQRVLVLHRRHLDLQRAHLGLDGHELSVVGRGLGAGGARW